MDFSRLSYMTVKAGETVTLICPFMKTSINRVVWYKQIFGEMPQDVGEKSLYKEFQISPEFKTSGFKMETTDNELSLTIPHIKRDDGALYYCVIFSWEDITLSNGTFLAVTGN